MRNALREMPQSDVVLSTISKPFRIINFKIFKCCIFLVIPNDLCFGANHAGNNQQNRIIKYYIVVILVSLVSLL